MRYRDALKSQLQEIIQGLTDGAVILPMVLCDFNVLAISSLFDPELVPSPQLDDANVRPLFGERSQIERLEKPSLDRGLLPIIEKETARLRALLPPEIAVGVRMNTGPLSLASELRGATELLIDMLEAPDLYHHFVSLMTDLYIEVRQAIHRAAHIQTSLERIRPDVSFHAPTTGVMVCDDSISLLGPRQFERFAAPYLMRIFTTFGPGTIHSCGNSMRLWPALKHMPGWRAFEFGEGDKVDWQKARATFPEKNLIYWDLNQEGDAYLAMAEKAMLEPHTFVYSQNPDHVRRWATRQAL
jgi:hypothetical protein